MKTEAYLDKLEWLAGRRGKITGSRLKSIVVKRGAEKKIGFYELIAERLGVPDDGENPMERGSRLESEAMDRFELETGVKVDRSLVIWTREDNESIAVSPDGIVIDYDPTREDCIHARDSNLCGRCGRVSEAVEAKCLSSARHIEAYLTQRVPDEYEYQVLQYFIVNDKLEKLNVAFYDPRFSMFVPPETTQAKLDFFVIEVKREDLEDQIKECLEYQRKVLAEVDEVVNKITGF